MTPLRTKMMRDMELQRLAPKTQKASIAAVAGLAKFYGRSPDQLHPDQIRAYLHHLLVERHRAWSSCHQVACGLKFFSVTTLGWDALHLHLPPRTGRRLLPHLAPVHACRQPTESGLAHDDLCRGPAGRGSRASAPHRHRK